MIAWDILREGASDYITIPEATSPASMRFLASGKAGDGEIVAGESAAAGLSALIGTGVYVATVLLGLVLLFLVYLAIVSFVGKRDVECLPALVQDGTVR